MNCISSLARAGAATLALCAICHAGPVRLSEAEVQVLRHLLADDLVVSASGGKSMTQAGPVVVSADKLQRDYERNEVAADRLYMDKPLLVSGVVRSIDRSIGKNYFVLFKGGTNPFMTPRASMAGGQEDFLAALEKGQRVTLQCQGAGLLVGSASLMRCVPAAAWAESTSERMASAIVSGAPTKLSAAESFTIVSMAIAIAGRLPRSSDCFAKGEKARLVCVKELERFLKTKPSKAIEAAANEAVTRGAQRPSS